MASTDIVKSLYTSVLGRPADDDGLAYFANALDRGATPEQVRQALATSAESQANIEKIFTENLKRAATADDVQYFTNAIAGGGLLSDAQRDIAASTEAQGLLPAAPPPVVKPPVVPPVVKPPVVPGVVPPVVPGVVKPPVAPGGTNTDNYNTINSIFRTVLGRDVDPTGAKYWGDLLASGTPIADITAGIRASAEGQTPAVQNFQRGTRTVPFGSQLIGQNVQQVAQYAQPAAQAGPAMGPPSLQSFLAGTPGAANLSPFQQSLQYQAALPGMIQPFNPADIPATSQQTLSPRPRLDISQTTIPSWLQSAINAQRTKDGIALTDQDKFTAANPTVTNSGLTPVVKPVTPGAVTPGTTGGLLAANQISPQIISGYTDYLGRPAGDIDLAGASYWQGLLNSGTPIADIYSGLAGSKEGTAYAPTRAAKIEAANAPVVTYYNE